MNMRPIPENETHEERSHRILNAPVPTTKLECPKKWSADWQRRTTLADEWEQFIDAGAKKAGQK